MPSLIEVYKKAIFELEDPRRDEINIRILLCYINDLHTMTDFYLHENDEIKDYKKFLELYKSYLVGYPVQYLVSSSYFYHRDFYVDKRVLIPRMETEEVVEFALNKLKTLKDINKINVLDCCAGSGCIGISLFKENEHVDITFSDISNDALDVCKKNAKYYHVNGDFLLGNGLFPSIEQNKKYHMIVANPPYILNRDEVDKSTLNNEPSLALFTTSSLPVYENIISHCQEVLYEHGIIIFFICYVLVDKLTLIVNKYLPNSKYSFYKDINKKYRIMCIEL